MQPTLIHKPALLLAGMSFYGDPFDTHGAWDEDNHIGALWKRFYGYLGPRDGAGLDMPEPQVGYEVMVYGAESLTRGLFEVFAGVEVASLANLPVEMQVKILPETDYAVFILQGQEIVSDWEMRIDGWLAEAGLQRAHPYSVQRYDPRFKGMDDLEGSVLEVWMPVSASPRAA